MAKRAIITGIFGQDGSYLAESLLDKGFEVFGWVENVEKYDLRLSEVNRLIQSCSIMSLDIADTDAVQKSVDAIKPHQIYHLAACHHSAVARKTFDPPMQQKMLRVNLLSTQAILDSMAIVARDCTLVYTASSQMYSLGDADREISGETGFFPATFYGMTKSFSAELIRFYRRKHDLKACIAIAFNHESRRRSKQFVTRRITAAAASIKLGRQDYLELANVDSRVDWSSAIDFVDALQLMANASTPKDYVLASGKAHRVADVAAIAFSALDLDWREYVRPLPSDQVRHIPALIGDPSAIKGDLGWKPSMSFHELIEDMTRNDFESLLKD